ncbi:MAG: hypothetical protein Q9220_003338 [cf. Caloplaca sp. 1 TL-2023]
MVARVGLSEVYEPPAGTGTSALIIFVHGLFGHPYDTWASKSPKSRSKSPSNRSTPLAPTPTSGTSAASSFDTGRANDVSPGYKPEGKIFWPRELLPCMISNVRIFTWGYDADIDGFGSASQNTIHQHAGSLLADISDQREAAEHYRSPIIFVVHSLGGIIVKAALNTSSATHGTRRKEIAPATVGICFLGTPHRGSSSASLGKIAYQISVAATRNPNIRLLQGLERNSETLDQIGDAFSQTMLKYGPKLRVCSFHEEKETRKYFIFNTMVVDADSAKIGDGREEVASIPASHSGMTKFSTLADTGFKRISAQLQHWIRELSATNDMDPTDIVGLLKEVVDSILKQMPQFEPYAISSYKDLVREQKARSPNWHFKALSNLMENFLQQRTTPIRLLLFLDALDEHEGDNDQLIHTLNNWIQIVDGKFVTLKICLASRPWPIFTDSFGRYPNLTIEIFTKEDIRTYVESRLGFTVEEPLQLLELGNFNALVEQITSKAQGVFIWVRLVVDDLAKNIRDCTPYQTLQRIVAETPDELQDLYDQTLHRISKEYVDETHIMLQIVLCTREPMSLYVLLNATQYCLIHFSERESEGSVEDAVVPIPLIISPRWLASRSGGLLETIPDTSVDEGNISPGSCVQFLHQTVKEYVQSSRAQINMDHLAPALARKGGYYFLTLSSHSYSQWAENIKVHIMQYARITETLNQIDSKIDLRKALPVTECAPHRTDMVWWLKQQFTPFFTIYLDQLYKDLDHQRHLYSMDLLHLPVLVSANLVFMIERILSPLLISIHRIQNEWVNSKVSYPCLLQLAIGGPNCVSDHVLDRPAIVRKLLVQGYSPLTRAVPWSYGLQNGRAHGVKQDFPKLPGLEMSDKDPPLDPLAFLILRLELSRISEETRFSIAEALLNAGADANQSHMAHSDGQLSLLSCCVQLDNLEMLRLLLKHGANPNLRDGEGWLPIDYAILRQDPSILAALQVYQPDGILPAPLLDSVEERALQRLFKVSTTVASSIAHPGLAILLARSREIDVMLKRK